MAVHHRKLRVKANPSCFDLSTVLEPVRTEYPNLIYLGIWYHDGSGYVYVQSAERMSNIKLTKALKDHMVMTNIAPYSTPAGELQEEWRSKSVRANKATAVDADTIVVFVHPLGKESLQHITSKFIADLLKTLPGVDVFFKFGLKLYSLEQNVSFRARKGDKNVRVCCSRKGWITVLKEEAYDEILQILVDKTQEAVRMFSGVISPCHIDHFEKHAESILDFKDSPAPEQRKLYERRRNKVLNNIAVKVTDNLNRLSNRSGKKRKLVYSAPPVK
ncbi:unnamed protein product, partial [Scytosiphon promiscuus]